jgi:antitoxin ParD1/3/4
LLSLYADSPNHFTGSNAVNVSVGDRWENYIDILLKDGRYGSASEIVREGLRLVEEREHRLAALRDTIEASIARGGSHSSGEAMAQVRDHLDKRRAGKAAA